MNIFQRWYQKQFRNIRVYSYCNIYPSARIGSNCTIGSYTEIGDKVKIGDNCKIQAMCFIPKGVTIGNNVFIAPKCCFTNDKYPKATGDWKVWETIVEDDVSIGANSTIICGVKIGKGAKIGSGAVVAHDIEPGVVVVGNPAKVLRRSKWK